MKTVYNSKGSLLGYIGIVFWIKTIFFMGKSKILYLNFQ